MPAGGDYLFYQNHYSNKTVDGALSSGGTVTVVPKTSSHQLFIQKIQYGIITHASGKKITAADGTITLPSVVDQTAGAGVPDVVVLDFGPKGRALTVGATLTITSESSGPVADVHIECYEKLGATINHLSGAANQ
jgi:hypothetical protein